jgi:hypothetical protein
MLGARLRSNTIHRLLLVVAVLTVVGIMAGSGLADSIARDGRGGTRAVEAATLNVRDAGKLHFLSADGNIWIEEGRATGTLPGTARVKFYINATTTTYSFTLHLGGGSISGRGTAKLHSGNGRYESFGGSATITGGTGRYAHISGKGGFYGVLDRGNDNAEVQVIGKLHF